MAASKAPTAAISRVHMTSNLVSDVPTAHADYSDVSSDKYESSIASHLFEHPDCCAVYSDDFVRLCHVYAVLDCFEAVYIHTKKPNLCKQAKAN